ncbi:MAG: BON domain-containing protein [bacterium]
MKTDNQLHKDVLSELTWDPRIKEKEIGVAAKDGVVTLTGSVESYAQSWASERAVERVLGVRAVANDLKVAIPGAYNRTDTDIAHRVVNALASDIEVPDEKIQSRVANGWVTLEGEVIWQFQRDAATRCVRNLVGIRGVSNNLMVKPNPVSEVDVTRSIKQALERRADRTAEHVVVTARGGIITLTGSVPSFEDRRAAEGAAWSAPGVSEVHDELAVTF